MTRIFLRIYGGIIAALLLVVVLSYGAMEATNYFRAMQYRADISSGTISLVADALAACPEGQLAQCVSTYEGLLGAPIAHFTLEKLELTNNENARLQRGQLVVKAMPEGNAEFYFQAIDASNNRYLRIQMSHFSQQFAEATAVLIRDHLTQHKPDRWPGLIEQLKSKVVYGVSLQPLQQAVLGPRQLSTINNDQPVVTINPNGATLEVFASLPGGRDLLVLGPIRQFDAYPMGAIALLLAVGGSFLGFVAYRLVRPLELRLRQLQRAAKRIKKGDLDARADVDSVDAIGQLSEAFNGMAEHIQRLLANQRELTSAVSHELRTPVARLRFGLEMIKDAEGEDDLNRYLRSLDKDIEELDGLVDEILTYARLEEGSPVLNFKMIDVDLIIQQIQKDLDSAAIRAQVKLIHVPENLPYKHRIVEGEERYIHRVIQNLVGNAIRYAQGQVHISFVVDGVNCRVDVEDDGPGIPEREWEHVFTPFARLDTSRNRSSGGYGLGLSIVQRIAFWHQGTVNVGKSRLGGAKFYIEWPRKQASNDADVSAIDALDDVENL
ncbi:MAG: two-component sensor histidine kinase [Gammaproteobacteria bacterium]|nr:MAG: two-component sensor histidine kinase [Gammaproteobacteria bacterium]